MLLIPAIDIYQGGCVRLLQGDFGEVTDYPDDPLELAHRYSALGAEWLHVVDLDGAKTGSPQNLSLIHRIARAGSLKVQVGGGVRDAESLQAVLAVAERVVLGSLAVTEPQTVAQWLGEFGPDRFTIGLDVRLDERHVPMVTTHGWTRNSDMSLRRAVDFFRGLGVINVLCTDVNRDGAMQGPNIELYRDCVIEWPDVAFQASGGVRDVADLDRLAEIGVAAAISGKALLEGRLSEREIKRFLPNA